MGNGGNKNTQRKKLTRGLGRSKMLIYPLGMLKKEKKKSRYENDESE